MSGSENKRIVIVGNDEECARVHKLVTSTSIKTGFIGYIHSSGKHNNMNINYIGTLEQLPEIIPIHKIDEVIFCAKDLSSQTIIEQMLQLGSMNIDYKIAPPESLSIIGSSSINTSGDLYVIDVNSVIKQSNRRNKRVADIFISLVLLASLPASVFVIKNPWGLIQNIIKVFFGAKSWVGYDAGKGFPSVKNGVLKPSDILKDKDLTEAAGERLNMLYIKDYKVLNDINIILKSFKKLGN